MDPLYKLDTYMNSTRVLLNENPPYEWLCGANDQNMIRCFWQVAIIQE